VLGRVTAEQTETALRYLAPGPDGARRYRDAFPAAGNEELYELVNSDWLFRMPTMHLADAHAAAGGRTHVYELTWPAPGMDGALGACHGLDVPLVFGNLSSGNTALLIGDTEHAEAEALSARIRAAWTSFAADGEPGWPAYDTERRLVQLLDETSSVTSYPEEASRHLWQQHSFSALPLIDR
jgi:para-nitrobenzyl esterase